MTRVTPEEVVEFVRRRGDMELSTIAQKRPFIVRVVDDELEYIPSTKKPRALQIQWLTRVCEEFNRTESMRPGDYSELTVHASYTLAVIDAYLKNQQTRPDKSATAPSHHRFGRQSDDSGKSTHLLPEERVLGGRLDIGRGEMRVQTDYQREDALRERINKFLRDAFDLPEGDYYAKLDVRKLLDMKAALSDINNALTMRLTLGFLKWVQTTLTLDAAAASKLRSDVLNAKPSSNGFDVKWDGPVPFIAEVKCNIPVNGGAKYGSAQRAGILKDVAALRQGKLKAGGMLPQSLKFMVFLDFPEVRRANEHLIQSNSTAMHFLSSGEVPSDPTVVYGVYVSLGD